MIVDEHIHKWYPFQTRPDQEWGIIGQASLLHSRPWALLRRISSVCWSWVASPTHYVPWHLFFSACGVVGPKLLWSAPNLAFASSESMLNLLKRNDIINGISNISNILAIFVSFLEKIGKRIENMINYRNMKHFVVMKCSRLFDIW